MGASKRLYEELEQQPFLADNYFYAEELKQEDGESKENTGRIEGSEESIQQLRKVQIQKPGRHSRGC